MNAPRSGDRPAQDTPLAAMDDERRAWARIVSLVEQLTPDECLVGGYYRDPDWSVRDVLAHLGTWLAEAQVQLERITAGTYEGHDVDVDGLNATFLVAMRDQPWLVALVQAHSARTRMLQEWYAVSAPDAEAAWWAAKAGAEHYAEHLDRLEEWVAELLSRREAEASTS